MIPLKKQIKDSSPEWLINTVKRFRNRLKNIHVDKELKVSRDSGYQIVHILHIGKTAGTAIRHCLKDIRNSAGYRIVLHDHNFTLKDIPAGDKCVFFIRDPIGKYISGFYSRKRQGLPKYHLPWSRAEKMAFELFQTPDELASALTSSKRSVRKKAMKSMNNIRHVKASFWDWFSNESYFISRFDDILFIGKQEHLSLAAESFLAMYSNRSIRSPSTCEVRRTG